MTDPLAGKLVTLIGGSGFFGTHIAQALLERGARLRIASRNPEKAHKLKPLANLGQLQLVRCDVTRPDSVRAVMRGTDMAVYMVGSFSGDLEALHAKGAQMAAQAATEEGASAFVQITAIGADPQSDVEYARTKGLGEQLVREAFPKATILRPSILFGRDDEFVNMLAGLIQSFAVLPVFGPESRLQLLHVDDASDAVAAALGDVGTHGGKTYEIGGPQAISMMELHEMLAEAQYRQRTFVPVPDAASGLFAALPLTPMNTQQWKLLQQGSVPGGELPGIARLGINPRPIGLLLDDWMTRYRKHGRFAERVA